MNFKEHIQTLIANKTRVNVNDMIDEDDFATITELGEDCIVLCVLNSAQEKKDLKTETVIILLSEVRSISAVVTDDK